MDRAVLWEELDRLSNVFGTRGWDIDAVAPVMIVFWADVPAVKAVWGP